MNKPSEKFYGKQLVQEYEDLLNYCKADNRAWPINWGKVYQIIEIEKLPKYHRHHYHCLVLGYWHAFNVRQKIERFHRQIRYGAFHSRNPNVFKELKDFLMNLKKDEWSYKWLDYWDNQDTNPFYTGRHRLNS